MLGNSVRNFRLFVLFCLCSATCCVWSCTSFQLQAEDGTIVYCRSLEFGLGLQSEVLVVARGGSYLGTIPNSQTGISWKVKYGFLGMNQSMLPNWVNDGMNEKGLVVGCLYLPGFAQYEPFDSSRAQNSLGAWELPTYLLSTCASVQEVKKAIENLVVVQQVTPQFDGSFLPVHFTISDPTGACLVIEYVGGKRHMYDNPLGVLTNSPPFDWQMNHLMGYVNLSPINSSPLQLKNYKVEFTGQGSGLLGLPGDYTASSRFVRASLFSSFVKPPKTALDVVCLGFHLLNTFDIAEGIVKSRGQETETTQWVVVYDLTNKRAYVRTYEGLMIQMIDLKRMKLNEDEPLKQIALRKEFFFENVTEQAKIIQKLDQNLFLKHALR